MGALTRAVWLLVLVPFSALFAIAIVLRRIAYRLGVFRSHRPAAPVVVVGNITVGGTGKTPLVIWLARELQRCGLKVGVATHGYAARAERAVLPVAANTPVALAGDEALLIAQSGDFLVAVAADRGAACQALIEQGAQIIVCDDGLQHYALQRDCEIAMIDERRGMGNGWLLPAGPLREPPGRLSRCDAVVINTAPVIADGTDRAAYRGSAIRMRLQPRDARQLVGAEVRKLADFAPFGRVHAVAAIGNPERFFAMLRELGLPVVEHAFSDHHAFVAADFEFADSLPVLMTGKDAVKCREFADDRMWEVPVDVLFDSGDAERLVALVRAVIPNEARH